MPKKGKSTKTKIMKQSQKVNIYLDTKGKYISPVHRDKKILSLSDKSITKRKPATRRKAPGQTIKRGMNLPQPIVVNVPQYTNFQPQMPQPQPMFAQMPGYNKGAENYFSNAIRQSQTQENTREEKQIEAKIMPKIVAEPEELKAVMPETRKGATIKELFERQMKQQAKIPESKPVPQIPTTPIEYETPKPKEYKQNIDEKVEGTLKEAFKIRDFVREKAKSQANARAILSDIADKAVDISEAKQSLMNTSATKIQQLHKKNRNKRVLDAIWDQGYEEEKQPQLTTEEAQARKSFFTEMFAEQLAKKVANNAIKSGLQREKSKRIQGKLQESINRQEMQGEDILSRNREINDKYKQIQETQREIVEGQQMMDADLLTILNKKTVKELIKESKSKGIPYSTDGRPYNKAELIQNMILNREKLKPGRKKN